MEVLDLNKGKNPSKGDRLKWLPLKDHDNLVLTRKSLKGKQLSTQELLPKKNGNEPKYLVP
jgi:hypothetical protein